MPPESLRRANYALGTDELRYTTSLRDASAPPPSNAWRLGPHAAGGTLGVGPSEVERGFRQPHNSAHYNILTNGPPLNSGAMGGANTEARRVARNEGAFEKPVGRQQHPSNDPRDRGPTGGRQSYDIISGIDRPRERW